MKGRGPMSRDFAQFDTRHYPTADVIEGYAKWAPLYDAMVPGQLDLPLLHACQPIAWPQISSAVVLGCGTGRIGQWLKHVKSVANIDGVDMSPDMLALADPKKLYRQLIKADVRHTILPAQAYDLAISVLAACHVADLPALYREAA